MMIFGTLKENLSEQFSDLDFVCYSTAGSRAELLKFRLVFRLDETVEQDRRVWENKMHISPRNIVSGDGPFASYKNWLDKFYTSNSKKNIDLNW